MPIVHVLMLVSASLMTIGFGVLIYKEMYMFAIGCLVAIAIVNFLMLWDSTKEKENDDDNNGK